MTTTTEPNMATTSVLRLNGPLCLYRSGDYDSTFPTAEILRIERIVKDGEFVGVDAYTDFRPEPIRLIPSSRFGGWHGSL